MVSDYGVKQLIRICQRVGIFTEELKVDLFEQSSDYKVLDFLFFVIGNFTNLSVAVIGNLVHS